MLNIQPGHNTNILSRSGHEPQRGTLHIPIWGDIWNKGLLPEVLRYVEKTHAFEKYVIDFAHECHLWVGGNDTATPVSMFEWTHYCLEFAGIDSDRVIMKSGDVNVKSAYRGWYTLFSEKSGLHIKDIRVEYENYWGTVVHCKHHDVYEQIKNYKNKSKVFTYFNGVPRHHRLTMLKYIYDAELMDKGFVTMLCDLQEVETFSCNMQSDVSNLSFPLILENSTDHYYGPLNSHMERIPNDFIKAHAESYLDVISETTMGNLGVPSEKDFYKNNWIYDDYSGPLAYNFYNPVFFTEKIWRAIYYGRPFLLLGCPEQLRQLHEWGFKTFSDFWDEGYDQERSHSKRILQVLFNLKGMCDKTDDEIKAIFESDKMLSILEHNRNRFIEVNKERMFGFTKQDRFGDDSQLNDILSEESLGMFKNNKPNETDFEINRFVGKDCRIVTR
jgi:hypothetical protein